MTWGAINFQVANCCRVDLLVLGGQGEFDEEEIELLALLECVCREGEEVEVLRLLECLGITESDEVSAAARDNDASLLDGEFSVFEQFLDDAEGVALLAVPVSSPPAAWVDFDVDPEAPEGFGGMRTCSSRGVYEQVHGNKPSCSSSGSARGSR